ncbi:DNA-directed RNA polymerase subunit RPB1 [uncultured virus]|nr:DNA-directed RNA polymerase subunit RPB1 [uncultured virus]
MLTALKYTGIQNNMEWVPLANYENGINLADRPRRLTQEEIVFIVAHVPLAPSADSTAAEVARQGIIEWMIETLKETPIAPSAIQPLIQQIIDQHQKSLVVPGTPVGITAAEAVGATTTQMTLNSVAFWERILIQDVNGQARLVKIGEWIDQLIACDSTKVKLIPENRTQYLELPHPVTIATPNAEGKVSWDKITAVTKHLPVGEMVKVITRSGREVTATQSKSLLVWDKTEEKLVPTKGKNIKVNDLVPILCEVPDPPVVIKEINLRKFFSSKEWLYGSELISLYNDHKAYEVPGKQKFWSGKPRLDNVPYARGDSALKACRDGLDTGKILSGCIYPKFWGGSTNTIIPEDFPLDKQFGQIIGLYLSEGWATDTFVGISNNAPEIQELVYKWCQRFGVTYHTVVTESERGKSTDINIHSVLFARWFKQWIGTGSADKIIPPEILLANREFIIGVLDGYFAGDGTVDQHDGYLCIGSASKDLITGFGFLCNRLGIFGEQSGHQPKSNNIGSKNIKYTHTYSIRNNNAVIWADLIGSCHADKQSKMKVSYKYQNDWANLNAREQQICSWGTHYQKQNNVMLDPVVSIEFVEGSEYVYDLTVPTTKNFSLYNGLGCRDTFHTSGSAKSASFGIDAMRDLIFARKTPKNESSTIYYTNKSASYEEVLDSRRYIVGSMVSSFIKDFDIDSPEVLQRYWWHDSVELLLRKQVPESTKVLRLFLNITEMFKHKVSISELAAVLEREIPPSVVAVYGPMSDGIIDIYPNPTIIVETMRERERKVVCNQTTTATGDVTQKKPKRAGIGVVPPELAEITFLESIVLPEFPCIRVKGIAGIKQLYPLISPVWRMVILERKLAERDLATEELRTALRPHLGKAWLLFYNTDIMRITGLTPQNLAALCQIAGLTIIAGTPDRLIVGMHNDRFRTKRGEIVYNLGDAMYRELKEDAIFRLDGVTYKEIDALYVKDNGDNWLEEVDEKVILPVPKDDIRKIEKKFYKRIDEAMLQNIDNKAYELLDVGQVSVSELKPGDYIAERVAMDKRNINKEIKRLTDINIAQAQNLPEEQKRALIRKPVNVPRTNLMKAAEFVIAETDGSNLKALLALPGIDKTRTTCNNMYTITSTLGIEAARTFLLRAITNTISNTGSYVHPANIMFIAEFITSRGEPYGATYSGISRQPGGHLSLATVERAGKVFIQNALNGRREDIRNVSASVAVGARMAIGSGAFDIAQEVTERGNTRTIINDDLFTALEKDDQSIQLLAQRAARVPAQAITVEDVNAGVDVLKTITVGGGATYDYTGAEDETNLITLFGPGEIIPDVGLTLPTQTGTPPEGRKVVRRVQPVTGGKPTTPEPIIPRELVDVLTQIKIGVPIPEVGVMTTITALETGVTPLQAVPQPIISTGLIPLDRLFPTGEHLVGTGIPTGLNDLLARYAQVVEGEEPEIIIDTTARIPPPTVVEELPEVEIPELPNLEGINLGAAQIELRREQVRDLLPIDTTALVDFLGQNQPQD